MRTVWFLCTFAVAALCTSLASAQAEQLSDPQVKQPAPALAPATPPLDASENPDYKRAVEDALKEYGLGHFEEARSLFRRAHGIYPNARTLRGLGMVEFELRHYVRASQLLEESLASTQKPLTDDQRRAVTSLLARTRQFIANYAVKVEPPRQDITLELDGKPVALDAAGRLSLEAGEHALRISAPDFEARELHIDVKGGEQQTLRIELEVKRKDPPESEQKAPTAPVRETVVTRPHRTLGIALTAAGGALVVTGGVLGALALGRAGDADTRDSDEADGARGLALTSDVALGVGLAGAIVGVVLMTRKKTETRAGSASVDAVFPHLRVRF
jgi:tetratricopeptide (TPR) repeat protein